MKISMNNAVGPQVRARKASGSQVLSALGALSFAGGLQSATQFFAHTFDYQAQLGRHVHHVYAPWSILEWSSTWYARYPDEVMTAASVGLLVATVGLLGVAVAKVVTSNSSRANAYLHGSARWAEKKDIEAAGLLPRPRTRLEVVTAGGGPRCGRSRGRLGGRGRYLPLPAPQRPGARPYLCAYPFGQGVGLIVPTLLSWGRAPWSPT